VSDPSVEPIYVTSLEEIFWGGTLVVGTMIKHGFGMVAVLRADESVKGWFVRKNEPRG
jgi:hypothetical protein